MQLGKSSGLCIDNQLSDFGRVSLRLTYMLIETKLAKVPAEANVFSQ